MSEVKHSYTTDGTNKGRVPVKTLSPGEYGDFSMGKGKARIQAPFPPNMAAEQNKNEGKGFTAK